MVLVGPRNESVLEALDDAHRHFLEKQVAEEDLMVTGLRGVELKVGAERRSHLRQISYFKQTKVGEASGAHIWVKKIILV